MPGHRREGMILPAGPPPAILFDFFGTLVGYSPSRTAQGYPRSHALVPGVPYTEFLTSLDATFAAFDARSDADDREFGMAEVAAARSEERRVGKECRSRW